MDKQRTHLRSRLAKAQSLATSGQSAEALRLLAKLCQEARHSADAWFLRGTLLGGLGKFPEAAESLRQAIELQPRHALSRFNLGNVLSGLGRFDEAAEAYARALELDPGKPEIMHALARVEVNRGRPREAIALYRRYLQLRPGDPGVYGSLGACHFHLRELEEAGENYRHALSRRRDAAWLDGLGATLCQQGRQAEAMQAHREAVCLSPSNARYHSNLLLSLQYLPELSPLDRLTEHRLWAETHQSLVAPTVYHRNVPDPERRLRVGYVSPDFRTHSVAYFFEALLRHHDEKAVESYCYTCASYRDATTIRLGQAADHWRDISAMNDPQAIERIRTDGIDILMDLAGHTAGNRLGVFAGRPAPVQITALGYPSTTGLPTIDYRLTDAIADPAGQEAFHSERLLRLPGCFLCYAQPEHAPASAPCPVTSNGFVTFGSFNNLAKINAGVVALWSRLLQSVPGSRLLIKNPSLSDRATADRYAELFRQHGLPAGRVTLLGLAPTIEQHLNTYRLLDIALDTSPYNGTTTTCEALYMGVPVITLAGSSHAGRVGTSLLTTLGLDELIAATPEDYLAHAEALAQDTSRLSALRNTLRPRLLASPLCDGAAYARKIERAYRELWRIWCEGQAQRT